MKELSQRPDTAFEDWQEMNRRLWERHENPVYAREAFFDAFKAGEPPPQWAAEVVLRADDRLLALRKGDGVDILNALGLKQPKGRSYVTRYREDQDALMAAGSPRKTGTDFARARRGRRLLDLCAGRTTRRNTRSLRSRSRTTSVHRSRC